MRIQERCARAGLSRRRTLAHVEAAEGGVPNLMQVERPRALLADSLKGERP